MSGCCSQTGLEVRPRRSEGPLGAGEAISSLKQRAAVRAEEEEEDGGGGGGGGGGGCSQQRGMPRMLSFNLESASHTLSVSRFNSLFLPRLYLTSSGVSVTMRKRRRVSDRQRNRLKMQSS